MESKKSDSLNHSRISPQGIKIYQNVLNPGRSQSDIRDKFNKMREMNSLKKDTLKVINDCSESVNLKVYEAPKGNKLD